MEKGGGRVGEKGGRRGRRVEGGRQGETGDRCTIIMDRTYPVRDTMLSRSKPEHFSLRNLRTVQRKNKSSPARGAHSNHSCADSCNYCRVTIRDCLKTTVITATATTR